MFAPTSSAAPVLVPVTPNADGAVGNGTSCTSTNVRCTRSATRSGVGGWPTSRYLAAVPGSVADEGAEESNAKKVLAPEGQASSDSARTPPPASAGERKSSSAMPPASAVCVRRGFAQRTSCTAAAPARAT